MSENYNFQPQQNPQGGYPQQGYQQPYPPTIDPEAIKAEKNAKIYSITSLVLGALGIGIFTIGFGIVAVVLGVLLLIRERMLAIPLWRLSGVSSVPLILCCGSSRGWSRNLQILRRKTPRYT